MPRVKRGTQHTKRRRKLLKKVKGYKWGRKKLIKLARQAALRAGENAFRDRRARKRAFRRLWQMRINAAVRQLGTNYSTFMGKMKKADVKLNRKVLSEIAKDKPEVFEKIVDEVK
jgi:large subunit ribosomal protein L20